MSGGKLSDDGAGRSDVVLVFWTVSCAVSIIIPSCHIHYRHDGLTAWKSTLQPADTRTAGGYNCRSREVPSGISATNNRTVVFV